MRFCHNTAIVTSLPLAQSAIVGKKCLCFLKVKYRVPTGWLFLLNSATDIFLSNTSISKPTVSPVVPKTQTGCHTSRVRLPPVDADGISKDNHRSEQ